MLQSYDERNRDLIVNIDGRLVHRNQACISPFDSSVQNGDAVWEGLRLYHGRIFRLGEHLARLRRSAMTLGYEGFPSNEELTHQISRTLHANNMIDGVHIRLTVSRGVKYTSGLDPRLNTNGLTLIILAEHKPPVFDRSGIRVIVAKQRRPFADVLDQRIHSCNQLTSILAKREAIAAGVDDAILLDPAGFVAETSSTHLFLVSASAVSTPRTVACPEGITRAVVRELCGEAGLPFAEREIDASELGQADEMFCSGTMGELVPVIEVDRQPIGSGRPGLVTTRLVDLFRKRVASEGVQVVSGNGKSPSEPQG